MLRGIIAGRLVLPAMAAAVAIAIFVADEFLGMPDGIVSLHVIDLMLCAFFLRQSGIAVAASACEAEDVADYLMNFGPGVADVELLRAAASFAAIAVGAGLAMQHARSRARVAGQARLLDLTHDAIVVRSLDNDIVTYWNSGAAALYGWRPEEAIGRRLPDLVTTLSPLSQEEMARRLKANGHSEGDLYRAGHDGRMQAVDSRWSLDHDELGRAVAVMETDSDVSERHQTERRLAAARRELADVARTAMLGEMTAAVAHEIEQPLAAILTDGEVSLRVLGQPSPDWDELRGRFTDTIANGLRAGDILKRTRALFELSEPVKAPVDLNQVVRHAAVLAEKPLRDHQIALRLDLVVRLPQVLGDGIQLEQVILSMLRNRAEAVAPLDAPRRSLSVRSWANGNRVFVAVEDAGEGLTPEAARQLFEPISATHTAGLGMGLRVCRSIIRNHGGDIRAVNRDDRPGTRFEFSLPVLGSG